MIKSILLIFCILFSIGGYSKSMLEIWLSMPEPTIVYIDGKQRQEMTDFVRMGLKGETEHLLRGKSRIDSLTANYLHVRLNEAAEMQIKRLPYLSGDSILCVVKTWKTPEAESEVLFYTQEWKPLRISVGNGDFNSLRTLGYSNLRPGSMSDEELKRLNEADFILTSAHISADSDELMISRVAPLDSKEGQEKMKAVRLKWNGKSFEE